MFIEMNCQCGAGIQLDGVNETFMLFYSTRFADAHTSCGYITPVIKDKPDQTKRYDINLNTNEE